MEVRSRELVLGAPIDVISWEDALGRTEAWAARRESRYVCICNVHSVVTARSDRAFSDAVGASDMSTPDGAPVAWMLRRMGHVDQERVNGPDFMWKYCERASARSEAIFLYGSTPATLDRLRARLVSRFPGLKVAGYYSPPFRALTTEEDDAVVQEINSSGAGIVWVSLGCPKQELWMAAHRGRINAVMVGVGAAFDYHAEAITRAPAWMQRNGLEWFYRLLSEPRRLWRRYLVTNSLFLFHASRQLLTRFGRASEH